MFYYLYPFINYLLTYNLLTYYEIYIKILLCNYIEFKMQSYNLEYYNTVSVNNMTLSENVLKSIQTLTNIFGESIPVVSKSTIPQPDSWKRIEQFKATQIEKPEGVDNYTSNIRTCLNKLSVKTYDTHKSNIIDNINNILNSNESTEVIQQHITVVVNSLFDIVSNNKFYSSMYADLYSEFCSKYDFFNEITNTIPVKYMTSVSSIISVNQNENYDKFCEVNKENDKRKSLITFIINLTKNNTLTPEIIYKIYVELDNKITSTIDDITIQPINDEIIENIFIIITIGSEFLSKSDSWETIKTNVNTLSKYKTKDHPGLSSRSLFKYMDMATIVNKIV